MLDGDEIVLGALGSVLASYGPRMRVGEDEVLAVPEGKAEFWGVYRHAFDGTASWVADAHDSESAGRIARMVAERSDPSTLGFLVKGFDWMFSALNKGRRAGVAMIEQVAEYAPEIDHAVAGRDDQLDGCFAYEVADPFGSWLASVTQHGNPLPSRDVAMAKLRYLVNRAL